MFDCSALHRTTFLSAVVRLNIAPGPDIALYRRPDIARRAQGGMLIAPGLRLALSER